MTTNQNEHLAQLLAAWTEHQDAKGRGANVDELMMSRARLDTIRRETQANLTLAS